PSLLLRAAIENRVPPRFDFLLDGDLSRLEIACWTWLQLEIAIGVAAAHEHRAVARAGHLPNMRRQVADCKADSAAVGPVGMRAVYDLAVVQRHLAGPEHDVGGLAFVDLDGDFLAARQQVVA